MDILYCSANFLLLSRILYYTDILKNDTQKETQRKETAVDIQIICFVYFNFIKVNNV